MSSEQDCLAELPLGRMFVSVPFADIWFGEEARRVRRTIRDVVATVEVLLAVPVPRPPIHGSFMRVERIEDAAMNLPLPTFTVIIPTYRRGDALCACLQSLAKLDYPRECFDVVVVDDGGGLPVDDIKASFRSQLNLSVLVQENAGPGAARNTAAFLARRDYLAFIDDDCVADACWLKAFATQIAVQPQSLLGGHTRNLLIDNIYSAASQHLVDCLYQYFASHESQAFFFATNNLAVPRRQFLDLQGFDGASMRYASEDREFCDRWRSRGWAMRFTPEAVVFHAHFLTLRTFWRQHFTYGRGAYRFRLARSRRGQKPLQIEAAWFLINLFEYPFKNARGLETLCLALFMLLTHVANLCGFLAEATTHLTVNNWPDVAPTTTKRKGRIRGRS